jgi:hypothetical protein
MKKIQVGFLMSYDYELLKKSIPPVYALSDNIFLAMDHQQRTWSGNHFEVDPSFYEWLEAFDVDKKIHIYKDNFYVPEINGIKNDTRERYMLALEMGIGNWLVQVDSDEIFIDFEKFVKRLRKYDAYLDNPEKHPVQLAGFHINVYKYLEDGLLYIDKPTKLMLATNWPNYKVAKNTRERIIYAEDYILHEGLARTEEELLLKLNNWSHKHEMNPNFLDKWRKANKDNYHEIKDVFYLEPEIWKDLAYLPSKDLTELKKLVADAPNLKIPPMKLFFRNFGQWFKHSKISKPTYKPKFESYFNS